MNALSRDPKYAYPHSRLAKQAYDSGDLKTAARHSRAACELEPNDETLWFRLALVLLDLQRLGEAITVLGPALERFPASSDLHGMMGRAFGQSGMVNESEEAIRYSITLNEKNETSWYNLTFCLMLQGRFDESRTALRRAVDNGYPDADAVERFDAMLYSPSSSFVKKKAR